MTCVVIDHSRMWSLLSWFSYERFWVVSAAEVFVVLSGIVLGMVYGNKLARGGWLVVSWGLGLRGGDALCSRHLAGRNRRPRTRDLGRAAHRIGMVARSANHERGRMA
jgi:hypothetical protein